MSNFQAIAKKIKEADAVIIGASNGLSITEGLHIFANNAAMHELFGDLQAKYGLQNLLQGMLGRWPSEEERWGFWSRLIKHYCGDYKPTKVMQDLKAIVGEKDYFVLTTNGEQHFQACGFADEKVYEVEGDWLHMTCSRACHDTVYPSFELALKMAEQEQNGKIPTELVPHCPHCGAPMQPHLQADANFIPNTAAKERFQAFLQANQAKKLVILELGVGPRNQLVKAPLMQITAALPQATYVTINLGEVYITPDIANQSFGVDGYLEPTLAAIREELEKA